VRYNHYEFFKREKKMKKLIIICLVKVFVAISASYGYTTFSISGYPGIHWNALGLAVNPDNGHIFLTSNSYGGEDNLYEFTSDGTLVYSTRANFDTGYHGNLDSLVVGHNGHLFVHAVYYPPSIHSIIEMSQDGQTIFSSLPDLDAHYGISYDPETDHLFYLSRLSLRMFRINEITTEGTLIHYFDLKEPVTRAEHYHGLVFDPFSDSFFVNELDTSVLDQYSKNALGEYVYTKSYDMNSIPLPGTVLAMGIDCSNGMFYAQSDNVEVIGFSIDELNAYTIPEPATLFLLGLGAVILRKRKK
jgi:hypothetical protein